MNSLPAACVDLGMWRMGRLFLLCLGLMQAVAHAAELHYKPAPLDNPLKGLALYYSGRNTLPHSLVYVEWPFGEIMPEEGVVDWSRFEARLESISNGGRQAIVRIYLDWPRRGTPIPKFLHEATYHRTSYGQDDRAPDYDSALIRKCFREVIGSFGKRYDGDPRIAFIEAGFLGLYGEWMFSSSSSSSSGKASAETQNEILDAYEAAFQTTKILNRRPTKVTLARSYGFHDDWFGKKDGELSYLFTFFGITNSTFWKTAPIGARIHPEIQECIWKPEPCRKTEDAYEQQLRNNHYSYLRFGNGSVPQSPGIANQRAIKFAQSLGYELYVRSAEFTQSNNSLTITATITNTGIAPFYYKWPVEIALAQGSQLRQIWPTDWDIRKVIPGEAATTFEFVTELRGRATKYLVLLRVRNRAPNGPLFEFANVEQNSSVEGWLTLGDFIYVPEKK